MAIPRIGQEVIVDFFDGDADQPIITGRTYNARNRPPYKLPEHKTRMTIKSDTHKGKGFNELRFEDEAGREEVFLHAQKDRNEKTRNNHTERIDNNWVQSIGNHKVVEVDGSHSESVHGSMAVHIGRSSRGRALANSDRSSQQGIGDIAVKLGIPGLRDAAAGFYSLHADAVISETTPGVKSQVIGVSKSVQVGSTLVEQAGNSIQLASGSLMSIDAGDTVTVTSGGEIEIRVGKAELRMTADGFIRLKGDTLYLDFENGVEVEGGKEIKMAASKINLN